MSQTTCTFSPTTPHFFHNRTPIHRSLKVLLCWNVWLVYTSVIFYWYSFALKMVYVVSGYKLTREQVLEWGRPHNLQPSEGNTTICVNRWLKSQGIKTRLLACDYERKCIFLVVTARKYDGKGTPNELEEDDRARGIKKDMKIDAVEFVTVADPYRYHH